MDKEEIRYIIFGLIVFLGILIGYYEHSEVLAYACAVLFGQWIFGLIIGLIAFLSEKYSTNT